MDQQPPNFNIFLNQRSFGKQTNQGQNNKNNQSQTSNGTSTQSFGNNRANLEGRMHELPETEYPTTENPVEFYKLKERLTEEMFTTRIGYRIRQYTRVQDDYICYLTNLLMTQCPFIKIFIIQPNFLYFQINSLSTQKDSSINDPNQSHQQQIALQIRILDFLKEVSEQVFNPWVERNLNQQRLMSNQFGEDELVESFVKGVVEEVKKRHEEVFSVKNK